MGAQASDQTCKYSVRSALGGWRVERAGDCLGIFSDPAAAVDEACRSARGDADHGRLAIVTTETTPQEFHCYVPPQGCGSVVAPSPPAFLRLLVGG